MGKEKQGGEVPPQFESKEILMTPVSLTSSLRHAAAKVK
jgi:hypothetical protein